MRVKLSGFLSAHERVRVKEVLDEGRPLSLLEKQVNGSSRQAMLVNHFFDAEPIERRNADRAAALSPPKQAWAG